MTALLVLVLGVAPPSDAVVLLPADSAHASAGRSGEPKSDDAAPDGAASSTRDGQATPPPRGPRAAASPAARNARNAVWPLMLGLGITAIQAPVLRPSVARIDPRASGRSTTMVGGATSLRWTPRVNARLRDGPWLGLEFGFRSGSMRTRDILTPATPSAPSTASGDSRIAHDVFTFESAALLYLAKSQFARLAVDAGGGGMLQVVRYELDAQDGRQRFGSGFVRLGASVEVLVSRVAFVFDLRGYGVITDRRAVTSRGALFSSAAEAEDGADARAPVATFQTMLVGGAALAVRF